MKKPVEQKRRGRPPIDGKGKKSHPVYLAEEHLATAKRLGNGYVSAGVRVALEMAEALSSESGVKAK